MTHDELLICVNMNAQTTGGLEQNTEALRAIVDLHKPLKFSDEQTMCVGCSLKKFAHPYPCPTIQTIEKELGL